MALDVKFSDGVRHLYIPTLNTVSQIPDNGMRYWLSTSDDYLPILSSTNDCLEIEFYDLKDFLSYWASDINRLSCAFMETVTNIRESHKNKKFLAWNLINYYYSAFYSAHSILKVLGFGLIQINDAVKRKVKERATILGLPSPNISSGIYCISIDTLRNRAVFYKVNRYDDSHKGLWQRFVDLLNVLIGISIVTGRYDGNCITARQTSDLHPMSVYSNMSSTDAGTLVARIDELKQGLNTNRDSNWLSFIRNLINYNQEFGIWFPYKKYQKQYDKIISLNTMYSSSPLFIGFDTTGEESLLKFVKTTQLINAMNLDILSDLNGRHPTNKSFLKNGFFKYNRLYAN